MNGNEGNGQGGNLFDGMSGGPGHGPQDGGQGGFGRQYGGHGGYGQQPQGPGGPGYGMPPGPESGGDPHGSGKNNSMLIVAGIAVVALLVAGLGAFMILGGDDEEESAEATGATTSQEEPADDEGATTSPSTPAGSATSSPTSAAPTGPSSQGDNSLRAPYASAVPQSFVDKTRNCRSGTMTLTTYGEERSEREIPGVRCSGVEGTPLYQNNVEFADDDEWSRQSIEQVKSSSHEVVSEEGGRFAAVSWYSDNANTVHFADTNAGITLKIYSFDTKDEALEVARELAG